MSATFDAYYTWLGIPPAEQPPHHYRLLGVQLFETNLDAIEHAADRQMGHIRGFQTGVHSALSQKLLTQISAARVCLLDPAKKARYDQELRSQLPQFQAPHPIPAARAVVVPVAVAPLAPPQVAQPIAAPFVAPVIALDTGGVATHLGSARRRSAAGASIPWGLIKAIAGGGGGLALGLLLLWVVFRTDPFGLFGDKKGDEIAKRTVSKEVSVPPAPKLPAPPSKGTTSVDPTSSDTANVPMVPVVAVTPAENLPDPPSVDESPVTPSPAAPPQPAPPTPSPEVPAPPPPSTSPPATSSPANPPRTGDLSELVNKPADGTSVGTAPSKHSVPTPNEQKAKLDEIKKFYHTEFDGSTRPANRESFLDFLMKTAGELKSDPVARYVLLREAYDRAVPQKDYLLAAQLIDALEADYAVDALRGRLHLLAQVSSSARQPVEKATVVLCACDMADYALRQHRLDDAEKLSNIANKHAKALPDAQMKARAGNLEVEIERLSSEWGPVARARQTLAQDPTNPEASLVDGIYRCASEGDWAQGLQLLAQSSDPALKSAAVADLAGASEQTPALALGGLWFEAAQANSARQGFYARALHWYQAAAQTVTGLDRVTANQRIEMIKGLNLPQRLADPVAGSGEALSPFSDMLQREEFSGPVNVFSYLNPAHLTGVAKTWRAENARLYSFAVGAYNRLQTSYAPPREYRVTLRVQRGSSTVAQSESNGPLVVGLMGPRGPFLVALDVPAAGGFVSFINMSGIKNLDDNKTVARAPAHVVRSGPDPSGQNFYNEANIVCEVRRTSVLVTVNGAQICRYDGDLTKLSVPKDWGDPEGKTLFLGSHLTAFTVESWTVEPLKADFSALSSTP